MLTNMNRFGNSKVLLQQKWETFQRVLRDDGIVGVFKVAIDKTVNFFLVLNKLGNRWRRTDHWILGLWVEWTGNKVILDNLQFSVKHPSIPTLLKSRLYMGRYEASERKALPLLDTDLPLVELGGGIGVIACLANHRLKNPRMHVIVEANPELIPLIEENRMRNGCQFHIINAALGYAADDLELKVHESMLDTNLFSKGVRTICVPSIQLESVLDQFGFSICSLICDIEGAEYEMILNEIDCLRRHVRLIVLETHPSIIQPDLIQKMLARLDEAGFKCVRTMDRKNFVYWNTVLMPHKDKNGKAGT